MDSQIVNHTIILAPEVIKKVTLNNGLLLGLKKTKTCCTVIVEPLIKIISLEGSVDIQNHDMVVLEKIQGVSVIIEKEFLDVYGEQTNFEVSLRGFLKKKLTINLPPEIITEEVC